MAMALYFSNLSTANSAGEANAAFTQQNLQHQNRSQRGRGFFGHNLNNDGSGPRKPNNNGSDEDDSSNNIPKYPQTKSLELRQERFKRIDDYLRQMNEVSNSDTESESENNFVKYEQAKKYAKLNAPERLNVNEKHHISGVMAAKKISHASEIGLNPVDYSMKAEHVNLIKRMGLYQ